MKKSQIPLSVPRSKRNEYLKNYNLATQEIDRLFLFAGDQKIEHMNEDFFGPHIPAEVNDPEHLFKIASRARIGCFAVQFGMMTKYAMDYKNIPYLVKINSKTNLLATKDKDPISKALISPQEVINFKDRTGLKIVALGYTVYLGSEFEAEMLQEASEVINIAHKNGMLSVIWMYPRGKDIKDEKDINLIAGASGVGLCLGTDFVKVNYPYDLGQPQTTAEKFQQVVESAGRTGVICAGGSRQTPQKFLQILYHQIHTAGTQGVAVGRNVYQRDLDDAIKMANAIAKIVVDGEDVYEAQKEL
jgi:fructose-bisphosphate aldolase/6-deoxy-5-ketofructose 1-phosphate synthase